MTSLGSPGLGVVGYQDVGSAVGYLKEDVKTLREEFWEDGAVKQQRPSAKRLEVKGTERERERPRNNEVIGTSNGPARDGGGEWERWGRVTGGWPYGTARNQGLSATIAGFNRQKEKLAGKQAKTPELPSKR
jgi:hypothetical protein